MSGPFDEVSKTARSLARPNGTVVKREGTCPKPNPSRNDRVTLRRTKAQGEMPITLVWITLEALERAISPNEIGPPSRRPVPGQYGKRENAGETARDGWRDVVVVGWTRARAYEKGKVETATFTRRRPISERMPFRRGKKRSRANSSAKSATATGGVVARAFKSPVYLAARVRVIDRSVK
jgi:hypothetical protein